MPIRTSITFSSRRRLSLDGVGALTACACACHCVATPLVLAAFPMLRPRGALGDPLEWGFASASLLIGAASFGRGLRVTHGHVAPRRGAPLLVFVAGLLAIVAARVLAPDDVAWAEPMGAVCGAALIVAAHLWNRRLAGPCCACTTSEDGGHSSAPIDRSCESA
jgi:MerC mercury resistance protein